MFHNTSLSINGQGGDSEYVIRKHNGVDIRQRRDNGYMDLTAIATSEGKFINHYLNTQSAKDLLNHLSTITGIPVMARNQGFQALVCIFQGGNDVSNTGTWGHPEVAMDVAAWCSPPLRVQVNRWALEITTKGYVVASPLDGLDFLQYQLDLMKEQQAELFAVKEEVKEVKQLVSIKLNPEAIRQRLNRIVRNVVRETNKGYNTIWSMIYDRLNTNFQADFSRRMNSHNAYVRSAKASGELKRTEGKCYASLLDFLQHQYPDYLSDMYEIAKEMFEDYLPPDLR